METEKFNQEIGSPTELAEAEPVLNSDQDFEIRRDNEPVPPVSGWLGFFLWIGIGLGMVISVVRTIAELSGTGFSTLATAIMVFYFGSMVVTGIMAITAFYKRWPNAVSLAMTYIAMIALDAVMQIFLMTLMEDDEGWKDVIRSFGWAAIWGTFLMVSEQVKERIPQHIRQWKSVEKILLIVYIVSGVSFCVLINNLMQNPFAGQVISNEAMIELSITEANKTFPQETDGVLIERMAREGNSVVCYYKFTQVSADDVIPAVLEAFEEENKNEMLNSITQETDPDLVPLYRAVFECGYSMEYRYRDMYGKTILSTVITPEEYYALVGK